MPNPLRGIGLPQRRRLTRRSFTVIVILTLIASYAIAWDRTRGTQKRLNRAIILMSKGQHEESLKLYNRVLSRWHRSKLAWTGKGLCELNLGRYDEALESYDTLLKIDPQSLQALQGKGMSYEMLGRYDEAINCFRVIRNINPTVLETQRQIDRINRRRSGTLLK